MNSNYDDRGAGRLASRVTHYKRDAYNESLRALNQDLFKMVTEVRFLEDELMAEQFKGETLRRENQQNQELIETLEQTLDRQGEQIEKFNHQMEQLRNKNDELKLCKANLKQIDYEMRKLEEDCDSTNDEITRMQMQSNQLVVENNDLEQRSKNLSNLHEAIQEEISALCQQLSLEYSRQTCYEALSLAVKRMNDQYQALHSKMEKLSRDTDDQLAVEKQLILKLQYEQKLAEERKNDNINENSIADMLKNGQQNDKLINQMLKKQEEYTYTIAQLETEAAEAHEHYQLKMQQTTKQYQFKINALNLEIDSATQTNKRLQQTIAQLHSSIRKESARYQKLFTQNLVDEQIGINLDGLKKLREAEERKQHLLFLIEDLEKQNMLLQEEKLILSVQL